MPEETAATQTGQADGGAASTEQATATEGTTATAQAAATTTETAAATSEAATTVPETYDLKAPEGSALDDAAIERTAATARELGLSAEHAQKALDFVANEVKTRVEAARAELIASYQPGGEEFNKVVEGWKQDTLASPDLGKTPEDRQAAIDRSNGIVRKYMEANPVHKDAFEAWLQSGYGNQKEAVLFLDWIARNVADGQMVTPGAAGGGEKSTAELLYGSSAQTQ